MKFSLVQKKKNTKLQPIMGQKFHGSMCMNAIFWKNLVEKVRWVQIRQVDYSRKSIASSSNTGSES